MTIKCSVFIATSLDGFIARRGGSIDWLTSANDPGSGEDYGYKAFYGTIMFDHVQTKAYANGLVQNTYRAANAA